MAVSFSTISGTSYPSWLSTFQTSLGHPILHGSGLFNHLWNNLSSKPPAFQASLGTSYPACLSASTPYPAWLWDFQACLERPILHGCQLFKHRWGIPSCTAVSFSTNSGPTYPAWLSAFQVFLGHPILNGCELFSYL